MMYSLKQAAEAVGRGKPAILRAIQKGIISATKSAKNEWLIDPSELHRVYPLASRTGSQGVQDERYATPDATEVLRKENAFLLEQIELLKDERQYLRRRLDDEAAERHKLTALLTHQQKPEAIPQAPATPLPDATADKGKLWQKLFGNKK